MTKIFAVDPGSEPKKNALHSTAGTGWCLIAFDPDTAPNLLAWGEIKGGPDMVIPLLHQFPANWDEEHEAFYRANREAHIRMVEGFTMRIAEANPNPLQTIGAMKLQECQEPHIPLIIPQPSQRNGVDMDGLRTLGLYRSGGHGHFREAIRHVVSWLIREGHKPTMMKLQPPDYEEM